MYILLIRTILLYALVVITMRIMGKRQIGQLQPYELVVAIMVSDLASLPMSDTRIPLMHGIIPIVTLLAIQVAISIAELKSYKIHTLFDGKPNIVIRNGKLQIPVLKSQIFSTSDLLEKLRIKGYFNINEIQYAILETNGELSVIPKSETEPPTRKDVSLHTREASLPIIIISDGKKLLNNLRFINKNEAWLDSKLNENHVKNIKDVFIAYFTTDNRFVFQYNDKNGEYKGEIDL